MGLGHPACPQIGHRVCPQTGTGFVPRRGTGLVPPLQPSLLFAAPSSHATGWRFGHVTPSHQTLGSQGGILELLSLEETQAVQRREQWDGQLQTHAGRTHTGATEQAATMALAVSLADKSPPDPKRASSLFRSHSHHQHSPWGWHWEPAAHTYPSRDTAFSA